MKRILFVFGTRPEAIKLCPLVRSLRLRPADFEVKLCVTGQHHEMLRQVLDVFQETPDFELDVMQPAQSLGSLTARILTALEPVLRRSRPDMVVVQGDTTSTMTGALASFYEGIACAHVEAGLRTGDLRQPFPEELNRVLTARMASLHFAPTTRAADALVGEGIPRQMVFVTGNTGIDAVMSVRDRLESGALAAPSWPWLDPSRRLILVTSHRRENFGPAFGRVLSTLEALARRGDVQVVYPVHPNPGVSGPARRRLNGCPNVVLLDPLGYLGFVDLMRRCRLILTDSGGIQEEAPSLGKPVLVLREKTERPEAVEAGTVELVGTDERRILSAAARLLDDEAAYECRTRVHNPYGDGRACGRIADVLARYRPGAAASGGY